MQGMIGPAATHGPILVNIKRLTFGAVFVIVFLCAGPLTLLNVPFRLSPVALLGLPLVLRYGIRRDRVLTAYIALTAVILISAFLNGSSAIQVILFMRSLVGSYLIYRLVDIYLRPETLPSVIRWCVVIGAIQLPVIALERLAYNWLPMTKAGQLRLYVDAGMGTFRQDAAMAFFLVLLVIFLLFDAPRARVIRHRWLAVVWFSLTIIIANSDISKISLVMVWAVYFARRLRARTLLVTVAAIALVVGVLIAFGLANRIIEPFTVGVGGALAQSYDVKSYLTGNYARGAAIKYYLTSDILWFGDGPLRYSDPIHWVLYRGNTGHVFTYYSEVGLFGWLLSVLIFFRIGFPGRFRTRFRGRQAAMTVNALAFGGLQVLSFTTEVLNHLGVVLIYCIVVRTFLIPLDGSTDDEVPRIRKEEPS